MTFTCVTLPLTAAYYFGAPIAGMASVIAGYPPLMIGGRKRSKKKSRKNKKIRYSKKLQRTLRNKKRTANKNRKR